MGSRRSADKIKFTSFDDLFGGMGSEISSVSELQDIPLNLLHPYHNHPYMVIDDMRMEELTESIRQHGVLNPGMAMKTAEGYELVSGHRRKRACELAGLKTMPVIVKQLTDDEAAILVVDSNIQREYLLPSEKAKAYRIKMAALKHQGKKGDQLSAALIGKQTEDSYRTVFRYIRLTYLLPQLLEYVDQKKLQQTSAENLSFLKQQEQEWVLSVIQETNSFPEKNKTLALKYASEQNQLTPSKVKELLEKKAHLSSVTLSSKRIREYFPSGYGKEQIEEIIYSLLDLWKKQNS